LIVKDLGSIYWLNKGLEGSFLGRKDSFKGWEAM